MSDIQTDNCDLWAVKMMFCRQFRPDTFSSAYTILKLCLLAFNAGWQVFVSTTDKKYSRYGELQLLCSIVI